jgi:hypothetical protein
MLTFVGIIVSIILESHTSVCAGMQSFAWLEAFANRLLAACKCTLPLHVPAILTPINELTSMHVWHHNKSWMKLVM